ncbi:MAG: hypothetical protein K9M81_03160 [Chthoniobacterales bacterium]|nr:hypothetical protein [Chthoniobacterales bacterium]
MITALVSNCDLGGMYTYSPRRTSNSTQHSSDFPASGVDWNEISGLIKQG